MIWYGKIIKSNTKIACSQQNDTLNKEDYASAMSCEYCKNIQTVNMLC